MRTATDDLNSIAEMKKRMMKKPPGFIKLPATVTIASSSRIPYEDDFAEDFARSLQQQNHEAAMRDYDFHLPKNAIIPKVSDLVSEDLRDICTEVFSLYPQFNQSSQETRAMITQDQRNAVAMKALGSVYTHRTKWTDEDLEAPILNNLVHIGYSEETISFTEFANIRTVLRRLLNSLGK